jgi:hypothetical protein
MNMIDYVSDALSGLGVQANWNVRPASFPSITFATYNSRGEEYGDGKLTGTGHYIQIDVWSKNDYTALVDSTKAAMNAAGFSWQDENDNFEDDTKIYHKVIKYHFKEGEV